MAEFIQPIVAKVLAVLAARTPELLEAAGLEVFAEYGRLLTFSANLPGVWVMPVRTVFAEEETTLHQAHEITVKFGVAEADPELLMDAVLGYMRAIHRAIEASWPGDWADAVTGGQVQSLFIREHDYGPVFLREGMLTKFPEAHLVVEVQELREGG